jgi:hypothetical protein
MKYLIAKKLVNIGDERWTQKLPLMGSSEENLFDMTFCVF